MRTNAIVVITRIKKMLKELDTFSCVADNHRRALEGAFSVVKWRLTVDEARYDKACAALIDAIMIDARIGHELPTA